MVDLQHETWINAPLEKVHQALTTTEGLQGWWTTDTTEEDNAFIFGFNNHQYWMKFGINVSEEQEIAWVCNDAADHDWLGTELKFSLENDGQVTKVKLTHTNWDEASESFARCNTAWGHLMFSLKNYVETGTGQPMS